MEQLDGAMQSTPRQYLSSAYGHWLSHLSPQHSQILVFSSVQHGSCDIGRGLRNLCKMRLLMKIRVRLEQVTVPQTHVCMLFSLTDFLAVMIEEKSTDRGAWVGIISIALSPGRVRPAHA